MFHHKNNWVEFFWRKKILKNQNRINVNSLAIANQPIIEILSHEKCSYITFFGSHIYIYLSVQIIYFREFTKKKTESILIWINMIFSKSNATQLHQTIGDRTQADSCYVVFIFVFFISQIFTTQYIYSKVK